MTIRTIILCICAALALLVIARIFFMLGWRQPRLARVVHHNYADGERLAERDFHLAALVDHRPGTGDFHYLDVTARVSYDVDGVDIRSDVEIMTHKGDESDSLPIVWIDPNDPTNATTRGIGFWFTWLLLIAPAAYAAWQLPA